MGSKLAMNVAHKTSSAVSSLVDGPIRHWTPSEGLRVRYISTLVPTSLLAQNNAGDAQRSRYLSGTPRTVLCHPDGPVKFGDVLYLLELVTSSFSWCSAVRNGSY